VWSPLEMSARHVGLFWLACRAFFVCLGGLTVKYLDDVLMVVGGGLLVYGVSLVSIPAAWIVAGVLCIVAGIAVAVFTGMAKE